MPLFEDDWFRYLWDGYRFAETGTPYGWAPADSFNDPGVPIQFQRILDQVNYPDLPTIYGPASQYAFLLSYFLKAGSLIPLQLLPIGVDILLIRLLLSAAPAGYVLLYAWCPLVIKENRPLPPIRTAWAPVCSLIAGKILDNRFALSAEVGRRERNDNVPGETFLNAAAYMLVSPKLSLSVQYHNTLSDGDLDIGGPGAGQPDHLRLDPPSVGTTGNGPGSVPGHTL